VVGLTQWLALPIAALLLLQWPLREVVARFSREANDFGQVLFALFVSVALTAAMRADAHLHTDVLSHRYPANTRKWVKACGISFALIPWSLFVLVVYFRGMRNSLMLLEAFPDTVNPGYFVIKLAAWCMALLLLLQSIIELVRLFRPPSQ
jgi:TRAP-type mannitol/chloroaromatic compound transport system permease small subunit